MPRKRKEEATSIQDKQVHFPPEPEAGVNLGANLVHLPPADFQPLSSQLASQTRKGGQRQVTPWQVGGRGPKPLCPNESWPEPGRARQGVMVHPQALICPPKASTAFPDFIFVTGIMLQCCQYGSREQRITDRPLSTFSFRTLVISLRFPL